MTAAVVFSTLFLNESLLYYLYEVQIFIQTNDMALYLNIYLLIKPHLNPRAILQVSEDEVDGPHHHLLHFMALATVCLGES